MALESDLTHQWQRADGGWLSPQKQLETMPMWLTLFYVNGRRPIFNCFTRMQKTRKLQLLLGSNNTVDGRNPAPVDRWFRFIPLFIGFQPSFWWCRISSIHSMSRATPTAYIGPTGLLSLIIPSGYNQSPVKHPDRHSNSLTPFHLT